MGAELMTAVSAEATLEKAVLKKSKAQSSTAMLLRRLNLFMGMFPPS
jgi:hypothetical protein